MPLQRWRPTQAVKATTPISDKSQTREMQRLVESFVSHLQLSEDSSRLSTTLRGNSKTLFPQHDMTVCVATSLFKIKEKATELCKNVLFKKEVKKKKHLFLSM